MGREDEIRTIAYRIWEEEGCCDGHDFNHWLKAEVIWEDKQKNVAAFSRGVDSTPEEPHGIHHSLILKVLGQ